MKLQWPEIQDEDGHEQESFQVEGCGMEWYGPGGISDLPESGSRWLDVLVHGGLIG